MLLPVLVVERERVSRADVDDRHAVGGVLCRRIHRASHLVVTHPTAPAGAASHATRSDTSSRSMLVVYVGSATSWRLGRRDRSCVSATRRSSRTRWAPTHRWGPSPKATWTLSVRSRSKTPALGTFSGSRHAAP